jgi:phenylacetate-coenzyme A ligase PaaK-like adenylate-forming protein
VTRADPDSPLTRLAFTAYAAAQAPWQRRAAFRSPRAIERAQRRRVRRAVAHAHRHVPYYRDTLRRLGLSPDDFRNAGDLARLPLIEREQLQRDPEYFLSQAQPCERYVRLPTDGTTGAPVVVYHDAFALIKGAAHTERREALVFRLAGRRLRMRRVFIGSPEGTLGRIRAAVHRRSLIPPGARYFDTRLPSDDPPAVIAERISALRPDLLRCYGSWLEAIFLHVHRTGMPFRAPRVAVYGGDSVSEPVRRLIEEFGVAVLSEYGAGEAHHIGLECERHTGLHLNCDLYPVRIVDPDGLEVPDGEPGEVVISNLVNRATVLLNYRLGDVAAKPPGRCPCGRSLPLLSLPQGRTDDWVRTPSGELLHGQAVRSLLLADASVLAFQVIQRAPTSFAVSVVLSPAGNPEESRAAIQRRFAERFGAGTDTEVEFVADLPRTPGGKVRTVISLAPEARPAAV